MSKIYTSTAHESSFATPDLGCAAALVAVGYQLVSMNKDNPRKVQFVFQCDSDVEKIATQYWSDNLEVRARHYFDSIKMLKNRLHDE